MVRKPYSHQVKRAKDLFGLIHTDVFQKEVENQLGKTIKSLRSDRGGEYISQEFLDHLKEHGIIAHRTSPYTPQNNGVSKRRNQTLLDMVRSMMSQTTLPKSFWDYALEFAARILNMVLTTKPEKLKPGSTTPREQKEDTHLSIDTSLNLEKDDQEIDEPQSDINPTHKSSRTRRAPDRMYLHVDAEEHELGDLGEPANYKAALLDPESNKWFDAMNVEMQSMKDNKFWDLVDLPPNGKTVDIRDIRILIAIAAFYDYEIWQMDVKTAFLNGYLTSFRRSHMVQPEGFVNPKFPNRVCKMKRSIYGLKQAYRQWNKRFDNEVKKFGFSQNRDEPCVYMKVSESYVFFPKLCMSDDIDQSGNNIPSYKL
ncbi:retrotransposon protein, putative, ty1-copia subclass [Tanacetum coccineum]